MSEHGQADAALGRVLMQELLLHIFAHVRGCMPNKRRGVAMSSIMALTPVKKLHVQLSYLEQIPGSLTHALLHPAAVQVQLLHQNGLPHLQHRNMTSKVRGTQCAGIELGVEVVLGTAMLCMLWVLCRLTRHRLCQD